MGVWHYPKLIHWRANARNGMIPSAWMWRQLVDAHNHIAKYRCCRQVYSKALELGTNGFYFSPQNHRTVSRTTVPMEWGVYASIPAGSGSCQIIDSAGSTYGAITVNSATPQWWTATFNIAENAEIFLVPQIAGDGANAIAVYAASVIEWETGP